MNDNATQPAVTMSLEERDKLMQKAGSIYETAKSYWPLILMFASMSGLGGAQVQSMLGKPAPAPMVQVQGAQPEAKAEPKAKPDDQAKRIEDLEKQVNLLLKRELDRSKVAPKQSSMVAPSERDVLVGKITQLQAKVASAEKAHNLAVRGSHGLDTSLASLVDLHREHDWLERRLEAMNGP